MEFEWDEAKRLSNIAQHGADLRDAALIFRSWFIEAEDGRAEYGEVRFRALGQSKESYIVVAYTWRGANRRIISAWKVDDEGQRRYSAILGGRS